MKMIPRVSSETLVLENTFQGKGRPLRHLHYEQDEWFYALESDFIFEVGQETFHRHPGDSLFAPRRVPHAWAHTGSGQGRILVAFFPAGQMEAFFRSYMKGGAPLLTDPEVWRAHGMEMLGPPLAVK